MILIRRGAFFCLALLIASCRYYDSPTENTILRKAEGEHYAGVEENTGDLPSISKEEIANVVRMASIGNIGAIRRLYIHYVTNGDINNAAKWAELGSRLGDCVSTYNLTISHFEDGYDVNPDIIFKYIKKNKCKRAELLYRFYIGKSVRLQ